MAQFGTRYEPTMTDLGLTPDDLRAQAARVHAEGRFDVAEDLLDEACAMEEEGWVPRGMDRTTAKGRKVQKAVKASPGTARAFAEAAELKIEALRLKNLGDLSGAVTKLNAAKAMEAEAVGDVGSELYDDSVLGVMRVEFDDDPAVMLKKDAFRFNAHWRPKTITVELESKDLTLENLRTEAWQLVVQDQWGYENRTIPLEC